MGLLSWVIAEGAADGVELGDLAVALVLRYSDDEPGSPWTWILYLDATATGQQRDVLEAIFRGRLGGDAETHFPWTWKSADAVAVRSVAIDVHHTRRRQRLRIRGLVSVQIRDRYETDSTVSCVIPGHDRAGEELVTEQLSVREDAGLVFDLSGVCGYATAFDYAGVAAPE